MATEQALLDLITAHDQGVLATIRRDGRPQLSTVNYAFDEETRLLRVSITDGRAKTANLRRDPRAAIHVSSPDGWSYAVADGAVELSAVAATPDDDAVAELIELYRAIGGEHDDWDDYRRAMIADGRLVLRLHVDNLYGQAH